MFNQYRQENKEFQEKVVKIRRVSKKTTGGNYVTFSALVVVGNRKGKVGIGLGRSLEVPPAIQKAISYAKKHMINVPMRNKTIPHEVRVKFKAALILLKPAPEGSVRLGAGAGAAEVSPLGKSTLGTIGRYSFGGSGVAGGSVSLGFSIGGTSCRGRE